MDSAMQWVELISAILGAVITLLGLIPAVIAIVKFIKKSIKDKNWAAIKAFADAAIKQAEASGKAGADKKQMVIDSVVAACKSAGISVDESALETLATYIDQFIAGYNQMRDATVTGDAAKGA
jgi:hypothetical protein